MATSERWSLEALKIAAQILDSLDEIDLIDANAAETKQRIASTIEQHCPFKEGVAYMPVPRCATCARWHDENVGRGICELPNDNAGESMFPEMYDNIVTSSNFGCVEWKAK